MWQFYVGGEQQILHLQVMSKSLRAFALLGCQGAAPLAQIVRSRMGLSISFM